MNFYKNARTVIKKVKYQISTGTIVCMVVLIAEFLPITIISIIWWWKELQVCIIISCKLQALSSQLLLRHNCLTSRWWHRDHHHHQCHLHSQIWDRSWLIIIITFLKIIFRHIITLILSMRRVLLLASHICNTSSNNNKMHYSNRIIRWRLVMAIDHTTLEKELTLEYHLKGLLGILSRPWLITGDCEV